MLAYVPGPDNAPLIFTTVLTLGAAVSLSSCSGTLTDVTLTSLTTLDRMESMFQSPAHNGCSDHRIIPLLPIYRQMLKTEDIPTETIWVWTNESVEALATKRWHSYRELRCSDFGKEDQTVEEKLTTCNAREAWKGLNTTMGRNPEPSPDPMLRPRNLCRTAGRLSQQV